jgi:putative peptidoglycan lipid II flippase
MSTNRKIASAYITLVAAGLAAHALSMLKEIIAARSFGVSSALDSFYVALTFPTLLNSILLSPFAIVFIPLLIRGRGTDKAAAERLISTVANLLLAALAVSAALAFAFAPQVVAAASPGLSPEALAQASRLLRVLAAGIVFTGGVNVITAVLNASGHFLWPAFSGMLVTLCVIAALLGFSSSHGVEVMAWGMILGTALQFLVLLPLPARFGFRHIPGIDLAHPELRRSAESALTFLGIMALANLAIVSNRFMASWLPEGSIAGLAYADRLVQAPLVIFSGAIASSIYPFLSAQAAENKVDELRATVSLSLRMSGFIFIPLAVTMMMLAHPTIRVLFQRGAFDQAATGLTSSIYLYYCLLMFSNFAVVVLMRVLFALQEFRAILKITALGLAANIAMNYALPKVMTPPACGIALSTALVSAASALLYFLKLKRRIGNLHGQTILRSLAANSAFALLSAPATLAAYRAFRPSVELWPQLLALAAAAATGLAVFLLLTAAFRTEEFSKAYNLVLRRLRPEAALP